MKLKDLEKNLNQYKKNVSVKVKLTKEQIRFIKLCREGDAKVPYIKMTELWNQLGWGQMGTSAMQDRCAKVFKNV